jgi:hypothetical protein
VEALRSSVTRAFGERGDAVRDGSYIGQGPPGKWPEARRKLGVGPQVRPGHSTRWGMTSAPHLAAAKEANRPVLGR